MTNPTIAQIRAVSRCDGTGFCLADEGRDYVVYAPREEAIAYLPTGRYVITSTLRITGREFFVGGSGWCTQLIWKGPEGGVMVEVLQPQHVTLEDLMIGAHDAGAMNNGIDIHQTGSADGSHMTYDGVYVFGMCQKAPLRKGLRFEHLGDQDVVVMPHVQGNLRFVDCGRATVLANCSCGRLRGRTALGRPDRLLVGGGTRGQRRRYDRRRRGQ